MAALWEKLQSDLGNWRDRLPEAWRSSFTDVALDFDAVDRDSQLADGEAIWPQEGGANKAAYLFKAFRDLRPEQVRVVIFGNDPYTRVAQATGRSFEQGDLVDWAHDIRIRGRVSPSMQSIVAAAAATDRKNDRYSLCDTRMLYDQEDATKEPTASQSHAQPIWFAHVELARGLADGAIKLRPPREIFEYWAKQGVLWLNRTLTYTKWDQAHREFSPPDVGAVHGAHARSAGAPGGEPPGRIRAVGWLRQAARARDPPSRQPVRCEGRRDPLLQERTSAMGGRLFQ